MFDNIVYLNRDVDVDRRLETERQLKKYGATATRFAAIESTLQDHIHQPLNELPMIFAQTSCLVSHLEIIRQYGERELLVFEDDVDLSTSEHWGGAFEDVLSCIDPSIGVVQLSVFPSPIPVRPVWWKPGTFGTVAYLIRPWYSKHLVATGYKDGKWDVRAFKSNYSQPLADSVLYSETPTISVNLFGLLPVPSTILPHATYPDTVAKFGQSWARGENNIEDIKASLKNFK